MQRIAPINNLIVRSGRRAYAALAEAAAESSTRSSAASSAAVAPGMMKVAKAAAESGAGSSAGKTEIFWMRDPKTGNWIPENRFGEVDVAELRELLLSKK